jgi:hypothetical protein
MNRLTGASRARAVAALVVAISALSSVACSPAADAARAAAVPPAAQRTLAGKLLDSPAATLRPGTIVRAGSLSKRVFVSSRSGVALASVGQAQYPAATSNGGKTWRTSGPALHLDAAQAPLAVSEVGALNSKVYFAAGGGEVVDATPDGGKHWYQTLFSGGVIGVIPSSDKLLAVIAGFETTPVSTWVYGSSNGGKTWQYEAAQ